MVLSTRKMMVLRALRADSKNFGCFENFRLSTFYFSGLDFATMSFDDRFIVATAIANRM